MRNRCRPRAVGLLLLLPLAAVSCAGLEQSDQGALQPQTVSGPCRVKKFFLMSYTAAQTDMTVTSGGQACSLTLIDANLQIFNTAALVTSPASHGRAESGLLAGGTQAGVSYVPQPGYTGPDSFTITLEPRDRAVRFAVTVRPAG